MILPQPIAIQPAPGAWRKTHRGHQSGDVCLRVLAEPADTLAASARSLADRLRDEQMFRVEPGTAENWDIRLRLTLPPRPLPLAVAAAGFADEAYRLQVAPDGITLDAATPDGIAMGLQSLRQLLWGQRARLNVPCQTIADAPALAWRGLHLDVSRHFWDVATVKRFIDLAAFHKFNLFHWHLTDDQGWRLPVKGYPRLTRVAAWREATMIGHDCDRRTNPTDGIRHGGFYTHDEIRAVVAHAAALGVRVLPEIDVPGHVQALVTAYPEFGCTGTAPGVRQCWGISPHVLNLEPRTFRFLERVIETVAELFPFPYVHLGGDEAKTEEWAASQAIQRHKRRLGIATDAGVQGVFTRRLRELLARHGRRMIGWDEIVEHDAPPPDTAVMFWRDSQNPDPALDRKALERGHPLVLANWSQTYFDLYQMAGTDRDQEPLAICGHLPLEKVYQWRPLARIPEPLRVGVLGAQAQVWTEYIATRQQLDYMVYPRACAMAQALWTGDARESLADFIARLSAHTRRLDALGITYRPLDNPPQES